MSGWIDAHCHLTDERLNGQLRAVLERSRAAGVSTWVQGGISPDEWLRQRELSRLIGPSFISVFGLHPWWVAEQGDPAIDTALDLLERQGARMKMLGELGLDFLPKRGGSKTHARQQRAFEAQLQLAKALALPIALHIVEAHDVAIDILSRHAPFPYGGLVHAFTGGPEIARRYQDLGLLLSVGGAITRRGYKDLKATILTLDGESLVIETDSPDQIPHRAGAPVAPLNEPALLPGIAEEVGRLRGESAAVVLDRSAANIRRILSL